MSNADAPVADRRPRHPGDGPDDGEEGRYITPVKVLLAVAILGIIAMWAYAFSPLAERPSPDALFDTSVGTKAEVICKQADDQLAALPKANRTATPTERADVVARSNQILAGMLDQLGALPVGGAADDQARDQSIYNQWVADWRTYLGDRQDYVNRLRTDGDARIFVTQKGAKQITEPLDGFAKSNQMSSCASPGDIY